jgi:hypothetical protein
VALNCVATQPGITSTIIGASKQAQLDDNLATLDFGIPAERRRRLEEASVLEPIQPYIFYGSNIQPMVTGSTSTRTWAPARATGAATLPAEAAKANAAER